MSLTRPEAVVVALYSLAGETTAIDTEDVAMKVASLVPGMFSWQKYPEQIDKELVRVALSDARLKKGWVVGSHNRGGWMLTPQGLAAARTNHAALGAKEGKRRRGRDEQGRERERARLLASSAYSEAVTRGAASVSPEHADAFFRVNIYAEGPARERKIARIENQFEDDDELGAIVKALANRARRRTAG